MNCKMYATFFLIFVLLVVPFVISPATADTGGKGGGSILGYCGSRCSWRCAKAGFKDRCLKYCGLCCIQCKCVPSGTFGNKHQCPCYRDKLNSKGKPKCP